MDLLGRSLTPTEAGHQKLDRTFPDETLVRISHLRRIDTSADAANKSVHGTSGSDSLPAKHGSARAHAGRDGTLSTCHENSADEWF